MYVCMYVCTYTYTCTYTVIFCLLGFSAFREFSTELFSLEVFHAFLDSGTSKSPSPKSGTVKPKFETLQGPPAR